MPEAVLPPEAALVADCKALCVGDVRFPAGSRHAYDSLGGAAAWLFDGGEGTIRISASARNVRAGSVELVCAGESCELIARSELHAYIVIAKDGGF